MSATTQMQFDWNRIAEWMRQYWWVVVLVVVVLLILRRSGRGRRIIIE